MKAEEYTSLKFKNNLLQGLVHQLADDVRELSTKVNMLCYKVTDLEEQNKRLWNYKRDK